MVEIACILFYIKPELDVPKITEWQKTNQSQVCPTRFDRLNAYYVTLK